MKYVVVVENNSTDLQDEVARYIEQGWKPQGGVSVTRFDEGPAVYLTYAQAMIREA